MKKFLWFIYTLCMFDW
ncbi:Protein of unknown function [Bacillus cereus]|nr:Protein of unknown function [Bacillus cereus]